MSELDPTSVNPTPEAVESQRVEFELLSEHRRTDGSTKTGDQLRREYVQLTDELIHQMTEGVPVIDHETGDEVIKKPDVVIWLDKSARPVSWLTKELWPTVMSLTCQNLDF